MIYQNLKKYRKLMKIRIQIKIKINNNKCKINYNYNSNINNNKFLTTNKFKNLKKRKF